MKYILIISIVFMVGSMASAIHFSERKPKSAVERVGHGCASKIEFSGHSYIVWQQNLSDCIIPDPDCKCQNPLKSTKLVDGPRGVMPPGPPKGANGPSEFDAQIKEKQ